MSRELVKIAKGIASYLILTMLLLQACVKSEHVDMIVRNATIYTVDETFSTHDAMAIKDGKIVELGAENHILNKYTSDSILDAELNPIFPGLIDAHCHFLGLGKMEDQLDLVGVQSFAELLARIEEDGQNEEDIWVMGRGWDNTEWNGEALPVKDELDRLFPHKPVLLRRVDGHAYLVNDVALDLAGITSDTKVDGGQIVIGSNDKPTGVLIDNACRLIDSILPDINGEQIASALKTAQDICVKNGLTTIVDAGIEYNEAEIWEQLVNSEQLKIRSYCLLSGTDENFDWLKKRGVLDHNRLGIQGFKFYADGALGSRGALLMEDYHDMPEHRGLAIHSWEYFREWAKKVFDADYQMATHCIGDSSNREVLKIYGEVLKGDNESGGNDRRWRIEHAQVVSVQDRDLFREYGVIPSVQPTHATSDMNWAEDRLGGNRMERAYSYQSLKNQLGWLPLGTDFPVEGVSPIHTFYTAVFRQNPRNPAEGEFRLEEGLTREEAIRGMTIWAALSIFQENNRGSLEPGKQADFVLLNRDLMKATPEQILKTEVLATYIGGSCVYQK